MSMFVAADVMGTPPAASCRVYDEADHEDVTVCAKSQKQVNKLITGPDDPESSAGKPGRPANWIGF
jgi:hypothetical protein